MLDVPVADGPLRLPGEHAMPGWMRRTSLAEFSASISNAMRREQAVLAHHPSHMTGARANANLDLGAEQFVAGSYPEAAEWAAKAAREQPNFLGAIRNLAASSALSGAGHDADDHHPGRPSQCLRGRCRLDRAREAAVLRVLAEGCLKT
jgi:hypothetical protein